MMKLKSRTRQRNMASRTSNLPLGDHSTTENTSSTTQNDTCLGIILSKMMIKEEIGQIPQFYGSKSIASHLISVQEKIDELDLNERQKADFLMATLHEDVKFELRSMPDYAVNKHDYDWLKETLTKEYEMKISQVSSFLSLMDIKQNPKQNLREFLSMVRIEGFKLLSHETPKRREELLLATFINGLENTQFTKALRHLKPDSLEEAYQMIKKECQIPNKATYSEALRTVNRSHDTTCDCKNKIQKMENEIMFLKKRLLTLEKQNSRTKPSVPFNRRENEIKCFKCTQPGHIAKDCSNKPFCSYCQRIGHSLRDCFKNNGRKQNIRNVDAPSNENFSDVCTAELMESQDEIDVEQPEYSNIAVVSKPMKKRVQYPDIVNKWANYINDDNARKPEESLFAGCKSRITTKTLISNTNSEPAANKPVVKWVVKGLEVSTPVSYTHLTLPTKA